ncbi:MAG: ArsR/SmtB family transcription factor [Brachymonas sp.]
MLQNQSLNPVSGDDAQQSQRVFEMAAELFGVLSTPIRLRILSSLCHGELSVSQLLEQVGTTQPNLSQHLAMLYQSGILAKRKEGAQVFYRVQSERAVMLCRSVCTQVAIELDEPMQLPASERLLARV